MLKKQIKPNIEKATVSVLKKGGRGVLVNGNFILTAAHCVEFKLDGPMALGEYFIEDIKTVQGMLKVQPLAIEPISDIAILGPLDDQDAPEEVKDFMAFCESTMPIPLFTTDFELFHKFPVYIYTHKGTWIKGSAYQCVKDAEKLSFEADEQIEYGTSGSPIMNEVGDLVGIISHSSISDTGSGKTDGIFPRPHLTLPIWIVRTILSQNDKKS